VVACEAFVSSFFCFCYLSRLLLYRSLGFEASFCVVFFLGFGRRHDRGVSADKAYDLRVIRRPCNRRARTLSVTHIPRIPNHLPPFSCIDGRVQGQSVTV
jgi:hypothetical protein